MQNQVDLIFRYSYIGAWSVVGYAWDFSIAYVALLGQARWRMAKRNYSLPSA